MCCLLPPVRTARFQARALGRSPCVHLPHFALLSWQVGVFEMGEGGMVGVANPSSLFMSHSLSTSGEGGEPDQPPGCAVAVTMEGTRALCVEVQVGVCLRDNAQVLGNVM